MSMGMGLTGQQQHLLDYIAATCKEPEAVAPSFEDMMDWMGLRSKSGIHRILTALEDKGYIRRMYARARSIEVLERPMPVCLHCGHPAGSRECFVAARQGVQ